MADGPSGTLHVELYHRPTVPGNAPVRRVERSLDDLHRRGKVDFVDESVWPREVPMPEGPEAKTEREAVEAYRRFSDWADRHGVAVEPPFELSVRNTQILGEGGAVLVTPVVCLAVYFDDTLLSVFPHTDDGETFSVEDGLASLDEERRVVVREREDERKPPSLFLTGRK
jgi:hypothetical protein